MSGGNNHSQLSPGTSSSLQRHWMLQCWVPVTGLNNAHKARDIHRISSIFSVMTEMDKIVKEKEIESSRVFYNLTKGIMDSRDFTGCQH